MDLRSGQPYWFLKNGLLGYGGNGITYGVIAARIITDLCLGHANPDARIFRFDR